MKMEKDFMIQTGTGHGTGSQITYKAGPINTHSHYLKIVQFLNL